MTSNVVMTRMLFFVLLTIAAAGGAGLDRLVVSLHAELTCPMPSPAVDHPVAAIPPQPFLPTSGGRSW
jgi:hypothetical protein